MSGATKLRELQPPGSSEMMDSSAMETEEYYNQGGGDWSQKVDTGQLCRVCASPNEYLIPIFDGEGLEHELAMKIQKHLPIKVSETDTLPLHICYQCASTLIAWHDLVISCVEADKKLRELQVEDEDDDDDKGAEMFESHSMDSDPADEINQPSTSEVQSQVTKAPALKKTSPNKEKKPKLKMVLVKGPPAGTSGQKTGSKTQVAKTSEQTKSKEGGNEDPASERSPDYVQGAQDIGISELVNSLDVRHDVKTVPEQFYSIWIKTDGDDKEYYLCDVKELENKVQITKSNGSAASEENLSYQFEEIWSTQLADHDYIKSNIDVNMSKHFIGDAVTGLEVAPPTYMLKCVRIGDKCHAKFVPRNQPVRCKNCSKCFHSEAVALTHLRTHTKFSPFYCKFCGKSFMLASSLKRHINNCTYVSSEKVESKFSHPLTKGNNEKYACTICGKMYKLKPSLKDHLRAHFGKARRKQKCEVCGEKFLTKAEIKEHVLTHKSHRFFTCNTCEKNFVTERDLIDHMISHTDERPFCCSLCGATYKRKSHLNRHALSHQANRKLLISPRVKRKPGIMFKCHYCGKEWPSSRLLMLHEISHTGERNYECHLCEKRFAQSGALTRHIHVVHDGAKDFKCEICSQSFTAKATKDNHMRIHTGEKPYQCDTCGKTFRTQQQHRIHERVHTDIRPYPCPYCEKRFRRRPHLVVHIRTHTGEKPYGCPICGRCFAQKNDMTKHLNIHNREAVPEVKQLHVNRDYLIT